MINIGIKKILATVILFGKFNFTTPANTCLEFIYICDNTRKNEKKP